MKKILFSPVLLVTVVTVLFTGCLKDKGFDMHRYGINDPDTQPPGIGFPAAAKSKSDFGLNVSSSVQAVNDLVYVNLESGSAASGDVHIALTNTTAALVAAYNSANGTNIQVLPSNLYNVALALTIPSGGRNAQVPLNVTSTLSLDPNLQYAVGLTISTVDGGYLIADNLKDLLVVFSVKNKYDGKYNLKAVHNRSPYTFPMNLTVYMITTGPASVAMYIPAFGDYGQPIGTAPGQYNWYGPAVSPNFIFNPTGSGPGGSDLCIDVNLQVGAAVTLAMVTNDQVADSNPDGPIVNRYEPGPKKMYLTFQYNSNDLRRFYDTLTYLGAR